MKRRLVCRGASRGGRHRGRRRRHRAGAPARQLHDQHLDDAHGHARARLGWRTSWTCAEIPTFQELGAIDADGDGETNDEELADLGVRGIHAAPRRPRGPARRRGRHARARPTRRRRSRPARAACPCCGSRARTRWSPPNAAACSVRRSELPRGRDRLARGRRGRRRRRRGPGLLAAGGEPERHPPRLPERPALEPPEGARCVLRVRAGRRRRPRRAASRPAPSVPPATDGGALAGFDRPRRTSPSAALHRRRARRASGSARSTRSGRATGRR